MRLQLAAGRAPQALQLTRQDAGQAPRAPQLTSLGAGRAPRAPQLTSLGAGRAPRAAQLTRQDAGRAPRAPQLMRQDAGRAPPAPQKKQSQNQWALEPLAHTEQNQQVRRPLAETEQNQQAHGPLARTQQNQQAHGPLAGVQQNQQAHGPLAGTQQNQQAHGPLANIKQTAAALTWERFPLQLSHTVTRGDRGHREDRSMVRIVVEAMQVNCRNPKRASCEEVAKIIVNRYPQTSADFTEKGERLGCGHYSLLRSIKSRVEHINRDNTTHRLRQTKRTRNEEDCSPNSNANSHKKVRCLVDSYGYINWQPVELPEGETPASLEEKKHILLTIFNSEGPGVVERADVDDFMCLTYISQRLPLCLSRCKLLSYSSMINAVACCPVIFFYLLHKMSWSFIWQETSTRMSLEAESNLPITPRLIMLGQSSMTATCWMVSAEGRVIVELDKENTFADAMSVFFGSFYVLNLKDQESTCARFFVRINPEEGTKCTSKVGTSRNTGTAVKRLTLMSQLSSSGLLNLSGDLQIR
uniref:Uncharacterized protein n=1 Tax=Maylandia zebra TaxID=106582 RepID=A0A3P9DRI4_9CICH